MAQFRRDTQKFLADGNTIFEVVMVTDSNGHFYTVDNRFPVDIGNTSINISGNVNVNFPQVMTVNSSPSNPVHVHLTEIGNNVIIDQYVPISGNVIITQVPNTGVLVLNTANTFSTGGTINVSNFPTSFQVIQNTSPWVISGNVNVTTTPITPINVKFPDGATAAFEELMVVEPYPVIQLDATYGLETDKMLIRQIGGGTAGANDIMWYASSGTTTGAGSISSKRYVRYRPGTGTLARFTALFTTSDANNQYGVTGVNQQAGLVNLGSGYLFGFSGLTGNNSANSDQRQFGILHRYNGKIDIHTLTINTAPTGSQTANVTLNGVSYTVALTAGTTQQCADQIAKGNTYGGSWSTDQVGNTVVFSGTQTGVRSGSYSFSSSGAGTLANGTIVQTSAGVNNTNDWTYIDKWDNPISFNPTKLNVFAIDMRWLGAGTVRFFMEDPVSGKMTLLHTQHWANKNTVPHVNMPSFRVGYASGILAGQTPTQSANVMGASLYGGIQGSIAQTTYSEGWWAVDTTAKAKDDIHHLISIRNPFTKANKLNTREFLLQDLSVSIQGSDPAVVFVYINPANATGQILFDTIPDSTAIVSTATGVTFNPAVNNPVVSFVLNNNGTAQFNLLPYRLVLSPGDFLSVAVTSTSGLSRTAASLTWATD
jgi:hypothetical protein